MASLIREANRPRKPWRVDWTERGRRRTRRFTSKREAEGFIGDLARGRRAADDSRVTVAAWLASWLVHHGPQWEARTRRDRAAIGDRLIVPFIGAVRLGELTRRDVRQWRTELMGVTTPFQVNRAVQVLSAALSAAVDDEVIVGNPCRGLRPLPTPAPEHRAAELREVEAIRAAMTEAHDRVQVSLMAYGGLRPNEVRALQWSDVRDATIVVRRGERASGRTKTGGVRTVPIIRPLRDDLDALERGDGLVVPPVDPHNWRHRVWLPARKRARSTATPYDLRHAAASLWIAEGRTVLEVSTLLGHSTPALTLSTYGHLFAEAQLRPGESVEDAVVRARHAASIESTSAVSDPV